MATGASEPLRAAYYLWKSESAAHTALAVGIVAVAFGPSVYRYWQASRGGR